MVELRSRTDGALVVVDEAAGNTDEASEAHGLGEATLANLRRGDPLHGVEQAGASSGGNGAVGIVGRPGILDHALEMSVAPN